MVILSGTAGQDNIGGTADDDRIEALDGDDIVFAFAGNDTVSGGSGDDLLDGGAGNDQLTGGAGDDSIGGADGTDTADGGLGRDTIGGGAGRDRLFGAAGADTLHGEAGKDSLFGGSGDDTLLGGADNDNLYGGPGQDRLSGGQGTDNLYGSDGSDILEGGIGDNLHGEAGDDTLAWDTEQFVLGPFQDGPNSLISGGEGHDTLRVNSDALYYAWTFDEGAQLGPFVSDIHLYHNIYGGGDTYIKLGDATPEDVPALFANLEGIERVEVSGLGPLVYVNGPAPDVVDDPHPLPDHFTVVGTVHDDFFSGGYGDEVLIGGAGNDLIQGSLGADRLEGGIGQDTVSGGAGADLFVYAFDPNLPPGGGPKASGLDDNDVIEDFNVGQRDVMWLDAILDLTPVQADAIGSDATEIRVTQATENAALTFGGNGATLQFDTFGVNDIGAIGDDTLQALEAKLIGLSGDSAYDPFQIA
jgi:Ca2+-binding RTX toxin-like protein